jgi:hypothetical protein
MGCPSSWRSRRIPKGPLTLSHNAGCPNKAVMKTGAPARFDALANLLHQSLSEETLCTTFILTGGILCYSNYVLQVKAVSDRGQVERRIGDQEM